MRLRDQTPLDPEFVASLDAIDSVLAGEPVDPRYAELAELALLVAAERPEPDAAFATLLDERVERRFAAARPAARKPGRARRRWLWGPAAGLSIAAVVAVLVLVSPGPSVPTRSAVHSTASSSSAGAPAAKAPSRSAGSGASSGAFGGHTGAPAPSRVPQPAVGTKQTLGSATTPSRAGSTPSQAGSFFSSPAVLQPPASGRKLIQGGQLALTASPNRIDTVAQEVFDAVGQERGIVKRSTVTATGGPGGYAEFELSIPSGVLAQTMAALSTLRYAHVTSRTDTSQDVTNQYNGDVTALADARALRTSLLKQLANATTQAQIDSLTAQLHDAEASISSDRATLRGLNNQVNYSQVTVTINGGPLPLTPRSGSSGGFTLHRAAHDAGRVLTVAAGAALIAAAALLPLAMLGALGWWVVAAIRRRRREHALDMA